MSIFVFFFFSYLSSFLKLKGVIYLEISIVFIHVHFLDDLEKKKKERKEEKKKKVIVIIPLPPQATHTSTQNWQTAFCFGFAFFETQAKAWNAFLLVILTPRNNS